MFCDLLAKRFVRVILVFEWKCLLEKSIVKLDLNKITRLRKSRFRNDIAIIIMFLT